MGGDMMGGFGGTGLTSLLWIVLLGVIVWAVVSFVGSNTGASGRADSALEVVKKRYARGEINKEEYEEKKKDLA